MRQPRNQENREKQKNPEDGFTLIELAVAILITGIVSVSLVQMLQVGQRTSSRNKTMVEMQQNARIGLESMANDLRHVSYGKDPTQPSIHYAGGDSVTFVADVIPEHGGAERISFFLSADGDPDTPNPNDTVLMRVVTDTAGVPLVSAPQAYGIAHEGLHFRWYNGGGVELASPVAQPEEIGEAAVSLTAAAAEEIGGTYPTMSLSQTIYPRNLPLSPARSRPSTPGVGSLTYPNCESATIPWTTPTTNTDGTPLALADISHFALYFGTSSENQSLYTKLARTINQWTISGLEGGQIYYLSVTCVSRSGVESYKSTLVADMTSANVPQAVTSLTASPAAGGTIQLDWGAVTHFESGTLITTPLSYVIYRSETAGFTPSDGNRLITVSATTQYLDSTMVDCTTSYYRVAAKACGNEGAPSPEGSSSHPALAECPSNVTGVPTANPGEIHMTWTPPALRTDGSSLPSSEIQGYRVYADTIPNQQTYVTTINGAVSEATVNGFLNCKSYYVNLQCVDACGHEGRYCPGNEIATFTSAPCDPATPNAPATCSLTPADDRMTIEWPANHIDCDIKGYKVYYGSVAGGPYNGTYAAQGPSPISLNAGDVTVGNVCRYVLTGLGACTTCYVRVASFDLCTPAHESSYSPEDGDVTTCIACETNAGCVAWGMESPNYDELHLELYTTNTSGETITRLTPTFSSTVGVREVWYGRPLTKIWAYDGSAGQDPPGLPRPSGTELNVTDFSVPNWTTNYDGQPFMIAFDSIMRDIPVSLAFRGLSGTCTAAGTGRGAAIIDDFDDGNFTANPIWTRVSSPNGSWSVSVGELYQSSSSANYVLKSSCGNLGDCTYEAKIKPISGGSYHQAYLVFRYQNATNYYVVGLRTDTDKVRVAKVASGTMTIPTGGEASYVSNDNTWYNIRLVTTGNHAKVWVNCSLVLDFNVTFAWTTGGLGVASWKAAAKWDDVKMFAGNPLP